MAPKFKQALFYEKVDSYMDQGKTCILKLNMTKQDESMRDLYFFDHIIGKDDLGRSLIPIDHDNKDPDDDPLGMEIYSIEKMIREHHLEPTTTRKGTEAEITIYSPNKN